MLLDNRLQDQDMLLRVLAYGSAKTKKTWWAGKAAEAGYNVLLLDGDDGWHILKQIKPEAQKRIQVVNMTDERGRPIFATAMSRLMKDGKLIWDEKAKQSATLNPNANCIKIDLDLMNADCVVVMDSWTAYVISLMLHYAKENLIDMSVAEEGDDKWGYYRWAGALASWNIVQLTSLLCHVIVVAHTDVYEKRSKDGKKIISSKRQIKSTSGPHAMQLPAKFSDILYFYQHKTAWKISTRGDDNADGGSRLIKPGEYNWEELQFKDLIKAAGLALPKADNPLIDYSLPTGKTPAKITASTIQISGGKTAAKPNLVKPVSKPVAKITLGIKSAK